MLLIFGITVKNLDPQAPRKSLTECITTVYDTVRNLDPQAPRKSLTESIYGIHAGFKNNLDPQAPRKSLT